MAIPPKKSSAAIKRAYVLNPARGLNNLVSESLVDQREASDLLNIAFDESGIVKKRDGFTTVGPDLTGVQLLAPWYSESDHQLIAVDAGQPKKYAAGTWSPISGVTLDSARPYINATQARQYTFFWDKTSGGVQYDGSATNRPGTIPKGDFSIYWNGLHIVSGVPGQADRVYFAAGGKPATFTRDATGKPSGTAAGDGWPDNATDVPGATIFTGTASAFTIDFGKGDGFKVTGLAVFQENIVVFKENAIYQLSFGGTTDSANATVTQITKAIGCVSHRTIAYVNNDIFFLSRKGVYTLGNEQNFYDAIRTNELSARIRRLIDKISPAAYERCSAVFSADRYLLSVPIGGSTVNRTLVYDTRYQAWSVWDTIAPRSMLTHYDLNGTEHVYFINDAAPTSMKEIIPGRYRDDAAPVAAHWTSGALDMGAIDLTKRFVDLGMVLRQLTGVLTISVYLDGVPLDDEFLSSAANTTGYGADLVGDAFIGYGAAEGDVTVLLPTNPWRITVKRNARTLKFKISNSRIDESFGLLGYIIGYYLSGYYRFDSQYRIY